MKKYIVFGGNKLKGSIKVSGAKNVAMKVILTGLLTENPIHIRNIPLITSVYGTAEIVKPLGVTVLINKDHTMTVKGKGTGDYHVPLELGGSYRTATMVMGPLLARYGKAVVPNPGGCRLGKRPIDRHIEAFKAMGAKVRYDDGYFYAEARKLRGAKYTFTKNTHTGTESVILAAVLAEGETVINNASLEPEVDDLINLLKLMGAKIRREKRSIYICGVKKLSGTEFKVMPDRNEVVTFAVGAIATGGDVVIEGVYKDTMNTFFNLLKKAKAKVSQESDNSYRFSASDKLCATKVATGPHPKFMTDWQSSWTILMTQARGMSIIHETVYEDRFSYVKELQKMGAKIKFFDPFVKNPESFYNFNWKDKSEYSHQGIKIFGKTKLHEAILEVSDLRAGATLLIAALTAEGKSTISGIEHIDRGYENISGRLKKLGGKIEIIDE